MKIILHFGLNCYPSGKERQSFIEYETPFLPRVGDEINIKDDPDNEDDPNPRGFVRYVKFYKDHISIYLAKNP